MTIFILTSIIGSYFSNGMIKKRVNVTLMHLNQYANGSNYDTSVAMRFLMWEASIKMWKKSPIIGTGLGDFRFDIEQMMENNETKLPTSWKHAHSFYLEYLATTGIIGFTIICFAIVIFPFIMFMKKWNTSRPLNGSIESMAGMTTILAFAMIGITWYWPGRSPMVITYAFCLIVFMSASYIRPLTQADSHPK